MRSADAVRPCDEDGVVSDEMPGFIIPHAFGQARSDALGVGAAVESVRKHRWAFYTLRGVNDIFLYAKVTERPQPEIDVITVHHCQDEIYYPGKNRWKPLELTLYEPVTYQGFPRTTAFVYFWWAQNVVVLARSRLATNKFKINCRLVLLDGFGNALYTYMLYGCWPAKVTPSQLDYLSSELAEISVTLQVDKVEELVG